MMTTGLKLIMKSIPQRVIFPFYHAVSDEKPLHLKHLYEIKSVRDFEKDLDQLLGIMNPLTMEDAISSFHVKNAKPGFHLTFDDGLKECAQVIAPILIKKGIPATFFVNSSFIDNRFLFHRHKASLLADRLLNDDCSIPDFLLQKYKIGHFTRDQVIAYILKSEFQHTPLLDDFAQHIKLDFDSYLKEQKPYLSLAELKWLRDNGFTIGSHSQNHPEFYRLTDDQIIREVDQDIQNISDFMGSKPRYFAYPFTDHFLSNEIIKRNIEKNEILSFGTAGLKLDENRHHYQRIGIENKDNKPVAAILFREGIFFHIKRILNRHYTNRLSDNQKKWVHRLIPRKTRFRLLILKSRLKTPFYLGSKITCNVCGLTFRKMETYGNDKRPNAKCPNCLSLERTRVLWLFLTKNIFPRLNDQAHVLHFAPELGIKKRMQKMKNIRYINADIDSLFADSVMDITDIPSGKEDFDLIICSHVLGHVPDEPKAISEMYRVLKPGGIALIMSLVDDSLENTYENSNVCSASDRLLHYTENNLVRLHGRDFRNRIANGGFQVEEIDFVQVLGPEISAKYSLGNGKREKIFKATKPA